MTLAEAKSAVEAYKENRAKPWFQRATGDASWRLMFAAAAASLVLYEELKRQEVKP